MTMHRGRGSDAALSFLATNAKQEIMPSLLVLVVMGEQEADQFSRRHKDLEVNATRDTLAWDLQWGRTAPREPASSRGDGAPRAYPGHLVCAVLRLQEAAGHMNTWDTRTEGM